MKDCLGDEQWASTLADKIYPEHSSILHALLSSFNDVVEFLMASVKFKSAKEKLNGICLAKVKNIRPGNVRGSVRLTRRKLASLTCEVQADDSTKELVQKVEACFKEKQEAPKKVKRRKRKHAFNVGYKRKSGDELRLVQKRDIVSSHVLCLYIFFTHFVPSIHPFYVGLFFCCNHFVYHPPITVLQVRWYLANKHQIKGSVDRAICEQFPCYTSRRIAHWVRNYHQFHWEDISDGDAARWSQVPNSWIRKVADGSTAAIRLKGPKETKYNLPECIKNQLEAMLLSLSEGDNTCMGRSEPIFNADIEETIKWLQSRPGTNICCTR